jgi:hypothetical protein
LVRLPCIPQWVSMESKNKTDIVYVDRLGFLVFIQILKHRGLKKIYCLDGISWRNKFFQRMLKFGSIDVVDANFFIGHLKTQNGESVYLAARRIAGLVALAASKQIVESEPMLQDLNGAYGRNTIRLFIAQQLARHIEEWTSRALVAVAISEIENPIVWLKKPARFSEETLLELMPEVRFQFYSAQLEHLLDWGKSGFVDTMRFFKQVVIGYLNQRALPKTDKPSILMLQEEVIRTQHTLRNQLYWLDMESEEQVFETYVLKSTNKFLKTEGTVEDELSRKGVNLLPLTSLGSAWNLLRRDRVLIELRRDRWKAYMAIFRARTSAARFFLSKVGFLLWQSELMGAISKALDIRVFVMKEPIGFYAAALQLCAERIGVRTIAIQYSNMGFMSPSMMNTTDVFLLFSDMYKQVFSYADLMPKKFISVGYLYDGIVELVRVNALAHRSRLQANGAKFIACYFDESVQSDRWGLISKEDHLAELHCLASAVLRDSLFGVIVKTQFMQNSPSQLYPNDELIRQAQATGRYLELKEGKHRNEVYPMEAALASDLCIGHKFGATAALEAAVIGVRAVILDFYGSKTQWDAIYASANIEFENIKEALEASVQYRDGEAGQRDLGDWTPILNYFVAHNKSTSIEATRNLIERLATDPRNEINP